MFSEKSYMFIQIFYNTCLNSIIVPLCEIKRKLMEMIVENGTIVIQ